MPLINEDTWLSAVGRVLFPPHMRCSLCGAPLEVQLDDGLCSGCLARMPWIDTPYCPRCGLPEITAADRCPDCRDIPASFSLNRSLWRYQGDASQALRLFKFQKRVHLAHIFAEKIAQKLFCNLPHSYDIITYVPMHPQAERMRGYNQSEILARELSARVAIPCQSLLLKKQMQTPQHHLGREARWQGLRGEVFALQPGVKLQENVLLIDDIFTTGATAHFCSLLLLEAGAKEIAVLSVAR